LRFYGAAVALNTKLEHWQPRALTVRNTASNRADELTS
jgi:hypothetical protein